MKPHLPGKGWKRLELERVPERPQSNGLVIFRVSQRWCIDKRSPKDVLAVPYVDRSGLIYATPVCWWKCTSYQLYATIVATVHKRLRSLVHSIPHKKRPTDDNLLLRIAIVYADTNDDTWYKRCLAMLFNNKSKDLLRFVNYKLRVDANKGFLYGQALYNASWLKLRSRFCRKCDKSTSRDRSSTFKLYFPRSQEDALLDHNAWRSISDYLAKSWSTVYRLPEAKHFNSAVNSGGLGRKSLLLFRGYLHHGSPTT